MILNHVDYRNHKTCYLYTLMMSSKQHNNSSSATDLIEGIIYFPFTLYNFYDSQDALGPSTAAKMDVCEY